MAKQRQSRRRRGHRSVGQRLRAALVLFAVEGKTEWEYLLALQQARYDRRLAFRPVARSDKTSLRNLVEAARRAERENRGCHVWIVCDTDKNSDHRERVESWLEENDHHHLALTHPSFEYWLLRHIDGEGSPQTAAQAENELKKRMPDYQKGARFHTSFVEKIESACERECKRRSSIGEPDLWAGDPGTTCHDMIAFLDFLVADHERREMKLKERK